MIRILSYLVAGVAVLAAAALFTLLVALGNGPASAWLVQRASALVPGELVLEGLGGDLLGGMSVDSMQYRLPELVVDAESLQLQLRWADLLERRVTLRRLGAARIDIMVPESEAAASTEGLPEIRLPFALRIDRASVDTLHVRAAGLDEEIADLTLIAAFADGRLAVKQLAASARGVTGEIAGELNLSGNWPLELRVEWQQTAAELSGSGTVRGDLKKLSLQQTVNLPDPVVLQAELDNLLSVPVVEATARWERLRQALPDGGELLLGPGEAALAGSLDDYRVNFNGELTAPGLPPVKAAASGHSIAGGLLLDTLQIDLARGRVSGSGRLGFAGPTADLNLVAVDVDPSLLVADLTGSLGMTAHLDLRGPRELSLQVTQLEGQLLGQPVAAAGELVLAGERLSLRKLRARSGANRVEFDGQLLPALDGSFKLQASALDQLWQGLGGSLAGNGRVAGSLAAPRAQLDLQGDDLHYGEQAIKTLRLNGRIDAAGSLQWDLQASGLRSGEAELGRLRASAVGSLDDHDFDIALDQGPLTLQLASHGRWYNGALEHEVRTGGFSVPAAGDWQLAAPFAVRLATDDYYFGAHCWVQSPSSLCLDRGVISAAGLNIAGRLAGLPMALLQPWLGESIEIDGSADASFALMRRDGELVLDFDWLQGETSIALREVTGQRLETRITQLTLALRATEQAATVAGVLRGEYGVSADLSGEIREPLSQDAPLDLRLRVELPDLSRPTPLLNRFVALESVRGRLQADLRIGGTLRDPEILGEASLSDGFAFLPQAGIDLQDIQVTVTGVQGAPLRVDGSLVSGGGRLEIGGVVDWSQNAGLYADLTIRGSDFQALRFPSQTVYISPDVRAHFDQQRITLTGAVLVPRAEVLVEALSTQGTAPSSDIVVHRASDAAQPRIRKAPLDVVGSLEVTLGDKVRFAGFGLDTRLSGKLSLLRPPGGVPARAEGSLRTVEGRFSASGKELRIDRGVLVFAGPLEDPSADVRATRSLTWEGRDITVGVLLTGPISALQTQVFGEPAMSETDALSFLILDRPAAQLSGAASSELSGSALALGLARVLPVTKQLEESLNLDEVGLEGSGGENTAVVAGKWINEDLLLRYSYGLFNSIGTFIIRYRVGGGFSIEAGSGQEQSLDLVYSIDR